jgi:formylglycine-generating enzyme required for sulfatase activity
LLFGFLSRYSHGMKLARLLTLVVATACTPPNVGSRPLDRVEEKPKEQCTLFERDPTKEPDLMAWDPTQRQKIHAKRTRGVVVVHIDLNGCDVTARVLDCVGKVEASSEPYEFSWYYANDTVVAHSQREAYMKLPLGAASVGAQLGSGQSLRVDYVMAGSYVLPDDAQISEWVGSECSEGTHYVTAVVVGGFARAVGRRQEVEGSAGLFGIGAGAGETTSQLNWRTEGSPSACREAEQKKSVNTGCDMPLRLELRPLRTASAPVPTPPQPAKPEPTPTAVAPTPPPTQQPAKPEPTPTAVAPTPPPTQQPAKPEPVRTAAVPTATPPVSPASQGGNCPSGMAWIPGGSFMMGSNKGDNDEKPVHRVELDGFCLDITPVTVDAYARCSGCSKPNTNNEFCNWGKSGKGNHPINCVDWGQASAYCRSVGKQLPTEAQWEYAARGGSRQLEYPWGSEGSNGRACWNRWDSWEGTCAVGSYASGAFGLKDMAGNVWEWVQDWYGAYPSSTSKNHAGPSSGSSRVCRGGGWDVNDPSWLRGAFRGCRTPDIRLGNLGFRCARTR